MPQLNYSRTMTRGRVGAIANFRQHEASNRLFAALPQITTVSLGGTTDGDYTVRITTPEGTAIDSTFAASSDTADDIVTGIVAALNDNEDLNNIVDSVAVLADDDFVLNFIHPSTAYTVSFPSNPGTNLTQTATQSSTRTNLPLGIAVCRVTGDEGFIRVPASTDTADDVLGVVLESENEAESNDDGTSAGYEAGADLPVMDHGCCYVAPEENVVDGDRVRVRMVAAGTEQAGAFRTTSDGTAQVATLTPGAGQNSVVIGFVLTMLTGEHEGKSFVVSTTSDASMTATEVADAWRVIINADDFWKNILTDTGTATLILTAANPEDTFEATVLNGVITIDNATTAGAPDTILMPPNWRWNQNGSAGQPTQLVIK